MAIVIKSYSELGPYIDSILKANSDFPVAHRHKDFWNTLTYTQFTTGTVPNVVDPTTNQPMQILVVGDSSSSNLIWALAGKPGSLFDPNTGAIGQMPLNGTPFNADQIKPIADWIDAKCPNSGA